MVLAGCTFAVMEASSQALDQLRLWGLTFEVGVFTNLTQDHLDYHKTFENYFAAKKSLFSQVKHMVVNLDDSYGRRLLDEVRGPERITFSAGDDAADYTARNIRLSASGVKFEMVGRGFIPVSYTHLRAHETRHDLVCRLLLEKKKQQQQ